MSDSHTDIVLEDMNSKFDAVIELVQDIQRNMATKADLEEVKADIKIIKAAVTDLSRQVDKHEQEIIALKAA